MQEFMKWLFFQRSRGDKVGDLASDAFNDPSWDGKLKSLEVTTKGTAAEEAFQEAVEEFRGQRKKY